MSKHEKVVVHLPHPKPIVELSPALADLIIRIIEAGPDGINTLELYHEGILSVYNHVSTLKKKGAIIDTELKPANDHQGRMHPGIAHYSYKGWA